MRWMNLSKVSYSITSLKTKWAKFPRTLIIGPRFTLLKKFLLNLWPILRSSGDMPNRLGILNINIVNHYTSNFLLLRNLSSHFTAVIVTLWKQLGFLNKFTLVTKSQLTCICLQLRFCLVGLWASTSSLWLHTRWFRLKFAILLISKVNLIKLGRAHKDVCTQAVQVT